MAKAATARRGRAAASDASAASGGVWAETSGVALVLLAMLGTLALSTYDPSDPLFTLAPVENRAGVVGAHLAALLQGGFGWGSLVLVLGLGVVGVRLLLGRGVAGVAGRTWVGTALAVVALAALPPLVDAVRPGAIPHPDGGVAGAWLASGERALLGVWGALLLNGFLLTIGALYLMGVATGSAVEALARVVGWLGLGLGWTAATLWAGARGLARGVVDAGRGARRAARRTADALRRGVQAGVVWRARRARKAKLVVARDESVLPPSSAAEAEPAPLPPPVAARPKRPGELEIVDHEAERAAKHQPEQAAFTFAERSAGGVPWVQPDIEIFSRPPAGQRR
ncbi:MAG TPA: DNA translocase FtsK 4TM domain-containing protein, partial [Myxococcota bacterium]|nr:DNA translocase FtsK 4TM domain-containing protein [Myxococcota bacterium]